MLLTIELPNTMDIISQDELLLHSLLNFFSTPKKINTLYVIVKQEANISLRLLDWFPTNYAKKHNIYINDVNIHMDYKNQLKGYQKRLLDPFCRRTRIFLGFDIKKIKDITTKKIEYTYKFLSNYEHVSYENRTDGIVTTVGQLNFFKWCIERDIIKYIFENIKEIDRDMNTSSEKKKSNKTFKKNTTGISKNIMKVTIKFN